MKRFFTFLFFFSITCSQAQLSKVWDHRYGGKYDDFTDGIIATADGGAFVFGYSYSDSSGDKTQQLKGFQDYWVVKADPNGVMEWNKSFGAADAFNYLTCGWQTQDGGFIVGGWTPADSSFDKSEDNRGGYDYWVIRMDALGNKLWDKTYGGNKDDVMTSVYATADGGFILGGYSSSDSTGDKKTFRKGHVDYWVIKTDANGQYQWEKDYGGTKDDYLYRVVETYDGGYYLFGASASDSSGDKSQDSKGTFDFWIIKTDANGNYLWDRDIGTPGDENTFQPFMDITLDNGAIMGTSSANANASGDKTVVNWSVFSDFWIVRLDSVGTKLWDQRYGGIEEEDEFWNVWHTADGGFLISGASYSDASGDKSEPNSQPLGVEQSWCIKVDGNGNKIWDKTMLNNDHNEGGMCTETLDGCVIINNYSSADSGGDKSEDSWNHSMDYFFAKYCIGGALPSSNFFASDTTICEQFCIDFTDQSANNPTSWQWSFPGGNPSSSSDQNPVNICYATPGIYDVTLITSNSSGSDTLVFTGYITVSSSPPVNLSQSNDTLLTPPGFIYQWYESGSPIAGATNYFYIPAQEGNYSVVVTDSTGCPGVDSIFFSLSPQTNFFTLQTTLCEKFCIDFFDQSTLTPISWLWIFAGGTPGNSTDQNPTQVCYQSPGTFDVTLITTNSYGADTLVQSNYITVYPTPPFPVITQNGNTLTSSLASSYQWQFNNTDIPGATNQSYTATQTGFYTIVISDSNGCVNSTTLYIEITGIEDPTSAPGFFIYPNPSQGIVVLMVNARVNGHIVIEAYNALGERVYSREEKMVSSSLRIQIDLGDIESGIYVLEVRSQEFLAKKKLVITE